MRKCSDSSIYVSCVIGIKSEFPSRSIFVREKDVTDKNSEAEYPWYAFRFCPHCGYEIAKKFLTNSIK